MINILKMPESKKAGIITVNDSKATIKLNIIFLGLHGNNCHSYKF
jgi:hypothetical protein